MKRVGFLVFLYFIVLVTVSAGNISFKHITGEDGLPSNNINFITQDTQGFMWFGTKEGLCRYDGYSFLNFSHSPTDSQSLSNNIISYIVEDSNKNLWIGTRDGLNKLNLESFIMERIIIPSQKDNEPFPIQSLAVAQDGKLWIGTDVQGVFSWDYSTADFNHYVHSTSDSTSISDNQVYSIVEDSKHQLWLSTKKGVDLYDPISSTFKQVLKGVNARILSFDQDGSVLVGALSQENSYYKIKGNGEIEKISIPLEFTNKNIEVNCDLSRNLWISVRDYGLIYSDATKKKDQWFSYDKYSQSGLSSNAITRIYEDKNGNIWIGTYDAGVNLFEKRSKAFIHIKDNYLHDGLQNNKVRSMYHDSDGDIWIGTKVNGALSKFDREKMTFTHYKPDAANPFSISSDMIFSIAEDRPGYLWVGTTNGLNLFEKKTGKSTVYYHNEEDHNSITSNIIYSLYKDVGQLYVGLFLEGMDVYDTKRETFTNYQNSADSSSLSDNKVRIIQKDKKGQIWVGTSNGLNLFNKENGTFRRFVHKSNDSTSISDNVILSIYEDQNYNFWIGTNLGLNLFDRDTETFITYTIVDGLPGNSVKSILEDAHGNLWLSTNNGISKFTPSTKHFKNYTSADGLQGNEFSEYVSCKTANGEMLFGGDNGFNIFHPDDIFDNDLVPNVLLTGFKLFGKDVDLDTPNSPLKKHISSTTEITLDHKQSVFSIEYVALNYTSTEKNQYAYMLEGFDPTPEEDQEVWNYVGTKREATYTNLNSGTYNFRVKASNNDGFWNEEGVALTINVLPPPWRSWWAYSSYLVLFIGLVTTVFFYLIKRVRDEKEHEQDLQNLRFFMNVSHEFRTPLTLILNPIQKLLLSNKNGEDREAVENINLSANKLLHMVNQLLDFRKTDLGRLPLVVSKTNIVEYSQDIFSRFKEIGESKNLTFQFQSSSKYIEAWIDIDKFETILNNLLSNAIKFTHSGGSVTLAISTNSAQHNRSNIKNNYSSGFFQIKIIDTGIGLSQKQITHVFERFYSEDETKTGIGIGLNYTKSLVNLHNGSVSVESVENEGSTFVVTLPLGNNHFKKEQLKTHLFDSNKDYLGTTGLESLKYDLTTVDEKINDLDIEDVVCSNDRIKPVVLVVEDNRKLRYLIKEELKSVYTIEEANNGSEGWEKAQRISPDIIVSDIMMPVLDGIEMCRRLKTSIETCHIPVILLTAKSLIEDQILGFQTGADDYVSKPFNMKLLKVRIKNLIDSRLQLKEKFSLSKKLSPAKNFTNNTLDEVFLDKVTKLIVDHLPDANFTQQKLEEKMGMSRSGLYKKINNLTGSSTSIFIRNVKLKYAGELLLSKKHTIKEIAYTTGFNSPSYFTNSFRKLYGQTPQEYVKENGSSSS